MTKSKYKNTVRVANCFAAFLILKVIEDFIVVPKLSVNIHSMFSSVVGLILLFIYMRIYTKTFEDIGLVSSHRKIKKGFLIALLLNVIAVAVVYPFEYIYYMSKGNTVVITAYYESADHSFSSGAVSFIVFILIGAAVSVVHALFYEMTFRGLYMRLCSRTFKFYIANIIQASLYTIWFFISVARSLTSSDPINVYSLVILILFVLVYEFITAIKMGLLRRASGALWMCIFDHIMFAFITDVIHFQVYSPSGALLEENEYIRLIAYCFVSLFASYIYYNKKLKKIDEAKLAASSSSSSDAASAKSDAASDSKK